MGYSSEISGVYMFKGLDQDELAQVSRLAQERNLTAGEELFTMGDEAQSFYVIIMGSIKVFSMSSQGDPLGVANLGSGAHFGEMPFFDQGKRSATAESIEPTRMLEISYGDLAGLMEQNPKIESKIYKSCARFLALRLRNTLDDLNQAREARLKHT